MVVALGGIITSSVTFGKGFRPGLLLHDEHALADDRVVRSGVATMRSTEAIRAVVLLLCDRPRVRH